jgi:hypothetical protein
MTDALEEAEALLIELPDAVSRRSLGERLSQAVTALKTADHQIERMKALIAAAEEIGYGKSEHQREALEEMVECALGVGEGLEAAEEAETLRVAVFEYQDSLAKAVGALERLLREHWRTVSADRFQPMIGLGALLTAMNVANNLGGRLVTCGQRGVAAIGPSTAPELLATIRGLFSDYDRLQAERAEEIGDDEVGDFINALAEKKATLTMVTPKVLAWLGEHDALDRLGINPR